jgi:hypothetical protein
MPDGAPSTIYEEIGRTYSWTRCPDERIAAQVEAGLAGVAGYRLVIAAS